MKHGSLFSGIGGFDLAASWMGWENVFHCEINPFCQTVLKYHFPESIQYHDITKTDFTIHRGSIDILTGGFPCQPFSTAGQRKGTADDRHLWQDMLRAIREIQPRWIVGENVFGLINWNGGMVFDEVQADLEAAGYEVWPYVLPAVSVDAPHRRDRVWFVAHDPNARIEGLRRPEIEVHGFAIDADPSIVRRKLSGGTRTRRNGSENGNLQIASDPGNPGSEGCKRKRTFSAGQWSQTSGSITQLHQIPNWDQWPTQSPVCTRNDGIPTGLDGITFPKWRNESIKAAGNAIVPQVVYQIFKAIENIH